LEALILPTTQNTNHRAARPCRNASFS
jgi:hypothetical protein